MKKLFLILILSLFISGCMKENMKQQIWLNVGDKFEYDYMVNNVTWVKTISKSNNESEYLIVLRMLDSNIEKCYGIVVSQDSTVIKIIYK